MSEVNIVITAETEKAAELLTGFNEKVTHGLEEVAKKVIAAFAVERIIEWGKRIVEGAEAMGHLAQQTGSSTESLSTWSYVLKIATVSQEEFNLGMKDAARFLGELDRGSAQAIETMRSLGLAGQSFKTLDEFLFAVSDRFKALPDGLRKTQDAITIFGRSGQQMIPVLNQGSEAIKATQQKARDLGAGDLDRSLRITRRSSTPG
jgi:hypothetical protein